MNLGFSRRSRTGQVRDWQADHLTLLQLPWMPLLKYARPNHWCRALSCCRRRAFLLLPWPATRTTAQSPVIAVVRDEDLDLIGQARPGQMVHLLG